MSQNENFKHIKLSTVHGWILWQTQCNNLNMAVETVTAKDTENYSLSAHAFCSLSPTPQEYWKDCC